MDTQMIVIAAIVAAVLIASVVLKKMGGSGTADRPRRRALLTKNESAMYNRLVQALPDRVILAQVSFGALLTARERAVRNRFDRKIADFVVCDKALQVIAVIELDDASHKGKESKDADRDRLLQEAGYRVLRYPRIPNVEQVHSAFNSMDSPDTASGARRVRAGGSVRGA